MSQLREHWQDTSDKVLVIKLFVKFVLQTFTNNLHNNNKLDLHNIFINYLQTDKLDVHQIFIVYFCKIDMNYLPNSQLDILSNIQEYLTKYTLLRC